LPNLNVIFYSADVNSYSDYSPYGVELDGRHGRSGYRYQDSEKIDIHTSKVTKSVDADYYLYEQPNSSAKEGVYLEFGVKNIQKPINF
jgi:hypothetical protein